MPTAIRAINHPQGSASTIKKSRAVPCTQHLSSDQRSIPVGKTPSRRGAWPPSRPSRPAAAPTHSAPLLWLQPRGGSGPDPPRQVLSAAGPWASREAEAAGLLQVGAALLLAHLPQVQRVVVQQREEPALGMGGCFDRGVCEVLGAAARFSPGTPTRTWPGRKCSWVTVAVSLCRPVSSTPGAPYLGGPSKKQRG